MVLFVCKQGRVFSFQAGTTARDEINDRAEGALNFHSGTGKFEDVRDILQRPGWSTFTM